MVCQYASQGCSLRHELIEARDAGRFKFAPVVVASHPTPAKAVASSSAPAKAVVSPDVPTSSSSVVPVRPASPPKACKASTPTDLESQPSEGEFGSFESEWGDVFTEEFVARDEGKFVWDIGLKDRVKPVSKKEDAGRFEEVDELAASEENEGVMSREGEKVVRAEKIDEVVEVDELAESESGGVGVGEGRKRKADSVEESPRGSPSTRTLTSELLAVAKERALTRGMIGREDAKMRIFRLLDTVLEDLDRLRNEIPESGPFVSLVARGHRQVIEELGRM
jgi:hypothetical protein